jgi:hypothetical protein
MPVEEQRRRALHQAAAASWGEEVADTLVELATPAGHDPATRADIEGVLAALDAMDERWSERFAAMDERWSERFAVMDERWSERFVAMDARLEAMDERWSERLDAMDERGSERLEAIDARWEERSAGMEHRLTATFERGLREAITAQTRGLVVSLLVSVVAIAGLAFGLAG